MSLVGTKTTKEERSFPHKPAMSTESNRSAAAKKKSKKIRRTVLTEEETREVQAIFSTLDQESKGFLNVTQLRDAIDYVVMRRKGGAPIPLRAGDSTKIRKMAHAVGTGKDPWTAEGNDPFRQFRRLIYNASFRNNNSKSGTSSSSSHSNSSSNHHNCIYFEEFSHAMAPVIAAVSQGVHRADLAGGEHVSDDALLLGHFHEYAMLKHRQSMVMIPLIEHTNIYFLTLTVPYHTCRYPITVTVSVVISLTCSLFSLFSCFVLSMIGTTTRSFSPLRCYQTVTCHRHGPQYHHFRSTHHQNQSKSLHQSQSIYHRKSPCPHLY